MLDRSNKELVALRSVFLGALESSIRSHCGMDFFALGACGVRTSTWQETGRSLSNCSGLQRPRQGQGLLFRNMNSNSSIAFVLVPGRPQGRRAAPYFSLFVTSIMYMNLGGPGSG